MCSNIHTAFSLVMSHTPSVDNKNLPVHRFGQGDVVTFSRKSPIENVAFEGTVLSKAPAMLSIVCKWLPEDLEKGEWRYTDTFMSIMYRLPLASISYSICIVFHFFPVLHILNRIDKGGNKLTNERIKAALKYFVSSRYEGPIALRYAASAYI